MAIEIERKFLLANDGWRKHINDQKKIVQGYLANTELGSVRIRLSGDEASLNIKSMTVGVSRTEYEYAVPLKDAEALLNELCMRPLIEKTRYYIRLAEHTWEIDVFEADNSGLVVAEIELSAPDEIFSRPDWLGREVSDDARYYNVALVNKPYKDW